MNKACEHCSIGFWAHHKASRFCSQKCAHAPLKQGIRLAKVHAGKRLWKTRRPASRFEFLCLHCGVTKPISAARKNAGEGKYCSQKCAGVANVRMGDKNHSWRGGVTPERKRIRESAAYKDWRKTVFERDGFTCQQCGQIGGNLHADHIKQFAYHPELRLDVNNGRTLCQPCHLSTESYGFKIAGVVPNYAWG